MGAEEKNGTVNMRGMVWNHQMEHSTIIRNLFNLSAIFNT
jgi:hypothetical protein